jgi:IS30 family transposase
VQPRHLCQIVEAVLLVEGHDGDAIATAYRHGYTMPAIARHLGIHPSTISRRLARCNAQIKT